MAGDPFGRDDWHDRGDHSAPRHRAAHEPDDRTEQRVYRSRHALETGGDDDPQPDYPQPDYPFGPPPPTGYDPQRRYDTRDAGVASAAGDSRAPGDSGTSVNPSGNGYDPGRGHEFGRQPPGYGSVYGRPVPGGISPNGPSPSAPNPIGPHPNGLNPNGPGRFPPTEYGAARGHGVPDPGYGQNTGYAGQGGQNTGYAGQGGQSTGYAGQGGQNTGYAPNPGHAGQGTGYGPQNTGYAGQGGQGTGYAPNPGYGPSPGYAPSPGYGPAGYGPAAGYGPGYGVGPGHGFGPDPDRAPSLPPKLPPGPLTMEQMRIVDVDPLPDLDEEPAWRRRAKAKAKSKRKNMPLWQELPLLLIVAFCLAVLIRTFLLQAFFIPSGSMEDTLLVGDRVLVNKVVYDFREPARGEVVVFAGPAGWAPENPMERDLGFFAKLGRTVGDLVGISPPSEKDFIKRVIGLPGDTVACCDVEGRLTVNNHPLDESVYVIRNSPVDVAPSPNECRSRRFGPIVVEPGQIFVMGDHRAVSQDSRCYGQVPIENVIGRAFFVAWPSKRWATLPIPKAFESVPKPFAAPLPGPELRRPETTSWGSGSVPAAFVVPFAASLVVPARSRRRPSIDRVRSSGD